VNLLFATAHPTSLFPSWAWIFHFYPVLQTTRFLSCFPSLSWNFLPPFYYSPRLHKLEEESDRESFYALLILHSLIFAAAGRQASSHKFSPSEPFPHFYSSIGGVGPLFPGLPHHFDPSRSPPPSRTFFYPPHLRSHPT